MQQHSLISIRGMNYPVAQFSITGQLRAVMTIAGIPYFESPQLADKPMVLTFVVLKKDTNYFNH